MQTKIDGIRIARHIFDMFRVTFWSDGTCLHAEDTYTFPTVRDARYFAEGAAIALSHIGRTPMISEFCD